MCVYCAWVAADRVHRCLSVSCLITVCERTRQCHNMRTAALQESQSAVLCRIDGWKKNKQKKTAVYILCVYDYDCCHTWYSSIAALHVFEHVTYIHTRRAFVSLFIPICPRYSPVAFDMWDIVPPLLIYIRKIVYIDTFSYIFFLFLIWISISFQCPCRWFCRYISTGNRSGVTVTSFLLR